MSSLPSRHLLKAILRPSSDHARSDALRASNRFPLPSAFMTKIPPSLSKAIFELVCAEPAAGADAALTDVIATATATTMSMTWRMVTLHLLDRTFDIAGEGLRRASDSTRKPLESQPGCPKSSRRDYLSMPRS